MEDGFLWFHWPSVPHVRVSAPSSQYPSLQVYLTVDLQVNGPISSIRLFSIDPGSLQGSTEKICDLAM